MGYWKIWNLQKKLVDLRAKGEIKDTLILLEHPPVLTSGREDKKGNIKWNLDQLQREGIEVVPIERGGEVTYHGPGQLVGYVIREFQSSDDVKGHFMDRLSSVMANVVSTYGLAPRHDYGVWIGKKKIGSVGIAIKGRNKKFYSYHGFALNVSTNLEHFESIQPCGLDQEKVMTSLQEALGCAPAMSEVKHRVIEEFASMFGYEKTEIFPQDTITDLLD